MMRGSLLSFAVATLLAGTPAHGPDHAAEIDGIFDWATPATPGCAVAASLHGKLVVNRGYGSADLERAVPIGPGTIFDVGSVTKQFVAAAVLILVEEGRLSLADDIRTYVPELPDTGHTVTLDHLLTHTSGIRDWTGIAPLAGRQADALTMILRQRGLDFAPGEEWSYSNSGYVLLKELVARRSGMSFDDFTRNRLFGPLGMTSTRYLGDLRVVVKDRALAYESDFVRWKLDTLLDDDRGGGGGLLSTVGDLLVWNDALTSARLGAFVTGKLQEPARLTNGRTLGYARGLFLDTNRRGGKVVWHTGSAGGYKSLVGRHPEQGLSIAILCNAGDLADSTAFARRVFDVLVPGTRMPDAEASARAGTQSGSMATHEVTSRAGLFFSERTGEPLRLVVDGGRLRAAGGPVLVAVTADRFRNRRGALSFMSQDEFEVQFLSPGEFELTSKEGRTTRYRRARPYAPTAQTLNAFAGRYGSDEIGAVLQVAAEDGGVVVRVEHAPGRTLEFRPVDPDTFQRGRMTLRFQRDDGGTVVGFGYSNPLLRNVTFTRLSERTSRRWRSLDSACRKIVIGPGFH